MKILVLCYEYPPLGGGGGRAAKAVSEELVRLGHEVRFQTARMASQPRREMVEGVDVRRSFSFRRRQDRCSVVEMGLYVLTSFLPSYRHIRTWRPDVIHAHFAVPTGALAHALHRITGVPYVLTAHLGDVPGGAPGQTDTLFQFLGPLVHPTWRDARGLTAVGEEVCELARAAYGRRPERIPNGIRIGQEIRIPGRPGTTVRLLGVGRLNPQKRFPFMIEILSHLADFDWHLDILGEGEERPAIIAAIRRHRLEDRVTLHGWQTSDQVAAFMRSSDLLLIPSIFEGLSVAAVEALAAGLAIVASDIGGLRDLVDHGVNGFLAASDDLQGFVRNLRHAIGDRETLYRMKQASAVKSRQFDLETVGRAYEAVLANAVAATPHT